MKSAVPVKAKAACSSKRVLSTKSNKQKLSSDVVVQKDDSSIMSSQKSSAEKMTPIRVAKGAKDQDSASAQQISQGRGLMGNGIWHVANTRVDLAANVAFGQQRLA